MRSASKAASPGGTSQPVRAVFDHLGRASHRRGDDRHAGGLGLQNHVRQALRERRLHEQVEVREVLVEVRAEARQDEPALQFAGGDPVSKGVVQGAVAEENETDAAALGPGHSPATMLRIVPGEGRTALAPRSARTAWSTSPAGRKAI